MRHDRRTGSCRDPASENDEQRRVGGCRLLDGHLEISDATMKNTSRLLVAAATLPTIRDRPRRRVRGNTTRAMDPNEAPRMKSGSWTETVYRVVIAADRLMTMDELRDAVGKVRTLEKDGSVACSG